MEIHYIYIDKFKKENSKDFLEQYNDMNFKNEKRFYEYTIGRYLVKSVAKNNYNLKNTDIIINENGKPVFKDGGLFFSITHSKNIVLACFDKTPCGADIEYIKNRDLEKFSKYYKKEFKDLEDFYKFWTLKEAEYKLGCKVKDSHFSKFEDKYFLTVVSAGKIE